MQTHDTAFGRGSASLVTPIRPLTRPLEFGRLKVGEVANLPPCETCDGVIDGGSVIYSFPVHNDDGRARLWHGTAQCAGARRVLRAQMNSDRAAERGA